MVEPTDGIMPILQRIQGDIAQLKTDVAVVKADTTDVKLVLGRQSERLNEMNGYMSFALSTVSRHSGENDAFRAELDAIKRRLARLEAEV